MSNRCSHVIKHMNSGAFDFVAKPSGAVSLDLLKIKKELHEKVMAARRQMFTN